MVVTDECWLTDDEMDSLLNDPRFLKAIDLRIRDRVRSGPGVEIKLEPDEPDIDPHGPATLVVGSRGADEYSFNHLKFR